MGDYEKTRSGIEGPDSGRDDIGPTAPNGNKRKGGHGRSGFVYFVMDGEYESKLFGGEAFAVAPLVFG